MAVLVIDSEDRNENTPMKVLLACGSLVLSPLFVLACLLLRRGFRSRAKNNLQRANHAVPQQSSLWTDRCRNSPSICETPISAPTTVNTTAAMKGDLQLMAQVPEQLRLPEPSLQRLGNTQAVTIIKNSIDDSRVLRGAPTERFNVSFFPHLGVFNIRQMHKRRRTWSPPKIGGFRCLFHYFPSD